MDIDNTFSPLANLRETKAVLQKHGLSAKYCMGQNFLVNEGIIRHIISLSQCCCKDCVLEVGPGIGTLTMALLKNAKAVVSIERDFDLPAVLKDTLCGLDSNFALIQRDALDVGVDDIAKAIASININTLPNKLIANLPYAIAATLVLDYFQNLACIDSATVMVQKEVADRMSASPGSKNYGAYTVKLAMFAQVEGSFLVVPANFFPQPRVDSTVIRLQRSTVLDKEGRPLSRECIRVACMLADAAFCNRRKTIYNSIKTYFSNNPKQDADVDVEQLLRTAEIDSKLRGEALSQADFVALAKAWELLQQ